MNQSEDSDLASLLTGLYGRINYERQSQASPQSFKLKNMREFLRRLGDPHLAIPTVHVAGTKGKGSVATMIGKILQTSGCRTGVYTSPHLESIHERIAINGTAVSSEVLQESLQAVNQVAVKMDAEAREHGRRGLTFFEVITATAFHCFRQQNVEAVVLEVGLGGRLDSTNVCLPLVSVITNISFDHTRQLGNTLEQIAFEKSGIIKPGVQVISGATASGPADVIVEVARKEVAPLAQLERDFHLIRGADSTSTLESSFGEGFSVAGTIGELKFSATNLSLTMPGAHQQQNAALAVAAIISLNQQGWAIGDDAIRQGLDATTVAGRTEIVAESPTIVLDIAHNVASAGVLLETISKLPGWETSARKTAVLSISREKDAEGMLRLFLAAFDRVVLTKYQDNPRGMEVESLFQLASDICTQSGQTTEILSVSTPRLVSENLFEAETLDPSEFFCVSGSVFLVAEMRPLLREDCAP